MPFIISTIMGNDKYQNISHIHLAISIHESDF